jgi:hypothetical protein
MNHHHHTASPIASPKGLRRVAWRALGALGLFACAAGALAQGEVADASPAERLVFLSPHIGALKPPLTLHYQFVRRDETHPGFSDAVELRLSAGNAGACCHVAGKFLTGERAFRVPEVPDASGNPIVLFFLEHEIRQLQRITKGQAAHFQKRIRLAFVDGASVTPTTLTWLGREVAATSVRISPFLDDPYRARFEREAQKTYTFVMSDAVPGKVYEIRAELAGSTDTLTLSAPQDPPAKTR